MPVLIGAGIRVPTATQAGPVPQVIALSIHT